MRPDLRHVEDIDRSFGNVLRMDGLNIHVPRWEVASLDSLLKISEVSIRLRAGDLCSFSVGEIVDPLIRFEMEADIMI
jgi:hypothetical protein